MKILSVKDLDEFSVIKWRLTDWCNYHCSYCIRRTLGKIEKKEINVQKDYLLALNTAPEINRIVEELPENVKIDLIGGEVSFFYLIEILSRITSPKLKQINITTNFSAPLENFLELSNYLQSRNCELGLVLSFHQEYMDLNNFINKVNLLKKNNSYIKFKCEMVSRDCNQELVKLFIQKCEENNIKYMVEADLLSNNKEFLIKSINKTSPRYQITYEDGSVEFYKSRNDFITSNNDYLLNRSAFRSKGFICTRDYNYVYIEQNFHYGNLNNFDSNCKNRQNIKDFSVLKTPRECKCDYCTLCGHMSLIEQTLVND